MVLFIGGFSSRPGLPPLIAEGHMRFDLARVGIDVYALAPQGVADGVAKTRIHYPVHGPGGGGNEAATYLMYALHAWVEQRDALLDAVFDALVITGLEMQAVQLFAGAPIAAVQHVAAAEEHRGRHGLCIAPRTLDHQAVGRQRG